MEPFIVETTGNDGALLALIAAQEFEVKTRYGVDDAGPGISAATPCLLARLRGIPVGCVAVGQLSDRVGEIKRMYVDPAARGHHIGRLLLQRAEELAIRRGYQLLRLETGTEQPEALGLYQSAGWRQIPCYGYFKGDPSTICLEKTVSVWTGEASRTGLDQDAPGSEGW